MISNSLDVDFIHGDIYGRSCKKLTHLCLNLQSYMILQIIHSSSGPENILNSLRPSEASVRQ